MPLLRDELAVTLVGTPDAKRRLLGLSAVASVLTAVFAVSCIWACGQERRWENERLLAKAAG